MVFKYQNEIDLLLSKGFSLPKLSPPIKEGPSFRFIFSFDDSRNHLPVYVLSPNRALPGKTKLSTSGYALSCIDSEANATAFYGFLLKSCKNIKNTIGDSLSSGCIIESDGLVSEIDNNGHFDLYEFPGCNLAHSFTVIRSL